MASTMWFPKSVRLLNFTQSMLHPPMQQEQKRTSHHLAHYSIISGRKKALTMQKHNTLQINVSDYRCVFCEINWQLIVSKRANKIGSEECTLALRGYCCSN